MHLREGTFTLLLYHYYNHHYLQCFQTRKRKGRRFHVYEGGVSLKELRCEPFVIIIYN